MKKTIFIILGIILIDQLTKGYILSLLVRGWPLVGEHAALVPYPFLMTRVTSWFNIVFTWNPGTAFSMFRSLPAISLIFLTGAIIGYLSYMLFFQIKDKTERLAMTFIVGGALGNLVDRIRFGAVIDFIDWHVKGFHWPSFNIADIFISLGVALYILHFIMQRKKANGSIS